MVGVAIDRVAVNLRPPAILLNYHAEHVFVS